MISLAVAVEDVWTTNGYAPLLEQPLRLLDAACDGALLGAEECAVAVSGAIPPAFTIAPPPPPPAPVEDPDEKLWEWSGPSAASSAAAASACARSGGGGSCATRGGSRLLSLGRASNAHRRGRGGGGAQGGGVGGVRDCLGHGGGRGAAPAGGRAVAEPMEPMEATVGRDVAEAAAIDADAECDGVRAKRRQPLRPPPSPRASRLRHMNTCRLPLRGQFRKTRGTLRRSPRPRVKRPRACEDPRPSMRSRSSARPCTRGSQTRRSRLRGTPSLWPGERWTWQAWRGQPRSEAWSRRSRVASQQLDSSAGDSTATRKDAALRAVCSLPLSFASRPRAGRRYAQGDDW